MFIIFLVYIYKADYMFISWYWIVLIAVVLFGYIHSLKRSGQACRHDRDALLEAWQRLTRKKESAAGSEKPEVSESTQQKEE